MTERDSILVVGSLAFDDLEMPNGIFNDVPGGAATYSCIAASLLAPVRLVGVIGDDFGDARLAGFAARGIDTTGVERAAGKTFRWHGRYADDLSSRTSLDTQLNVFASFRPKIPAVYRRSPIVLLGNIHPSLQLEVLEQVERPKLVIADTMNFWIAGEPKILAQMLRRTDLLVINDEEARELSGIHSIAKAADDIRKRGPTRLIIKRGEHGAILFDDEGMFFVPAYPLHNVVDPTGAGDTFAGGLVGYLGRHADVSPRALRRAMYFGAALASFCVEDIGPKRLEEINAANLSERLAAFERLVDYGGNLGAHP